MTTTPRTPTSSISEDHITPLLSTNEDGLITSWCTPQLRERNAEAFDSFNAKAVHKQVQAEIWRIEEAKLDALLAQHKCAQATNERIAINGDGLHVTEIGPYPGIGPQQPPPQQLDTSLLGKVVLLLLVVCAAIALLAMANGPIVWVLISGVSFFLGYQSNQERASDLTDTQRLEELANKHHHHRQDAGV